MDFCFHDRADGSIAVFQLRGSTSPILHIVPDADWPGMWRVRMPDGTLSDMVNKSRAKYAAIKAAEEVLLEKRRAVSNKNGVVA
jgi:hypothetical protein